MTGFRWFDECPFCGAKTSAETQLVLGQKVRAHLDVCLTEQFAKLRASDANALQGDLFSGPKKQPPKLVLVVCETVAAVVPHFRLVTATTPLKFGGHADPRPKTLCDRPVGWDTKLPLAAAACRSCIAALVRMRSELS